ncbi:endonuclease/exonuclease/phosphatase family protein [Roseimaritima ulvae]|uniref:Endonuclease/Exonuclease/phosphatase family protein n=1 Tax=Roseimaritima ulvae TaxID=980254 RepID=A0A5B9R9E5_9BACT|nr:endonuclease/exonuclease/phosphatase family protein [Roseimaritima ulvae]QEG43611.1 Endonuclease/Exonuclease/phosphatase family protein [Roseimaritima ulvae]
MIQTPSDNPPKSPVNRRDLLKGAAMGGLAMAATHATGLSAAEPEDRSLRVIAYNVYKCTGWPKDRARAKQATAAGQMPDRIAMELALYQPDIINFSESPDEAVVKRIAERLRMNYVRFPSGGNWPGTLLSRYEIEASKNVPLVSGERPKDLFTRHWGRATIRLPDAGPLIVHSAHLYPGADPAIRLREIPAMLESMRDDFEANRSMLLIGDLNHGPDTEEYKMWIDAGWVDTFSKVGKGDGLTIKADKPQWRIDYVMAAGAIAQNIYQSKPLFEGAFRTNPADPESFALSDHLPQLAEFEYTVAK